MQLINTGLAEQFMVHTKVSLWAGMIGAFPYILYHLFRFVSPALYDDEKRYAFRIVSCGYVMFMIGMAFSYFLIFPLTVRFLGTYQVSEDVQNMVTLQSYVSTLLILSLSLGVMFEMPMLSWLFAKLGFLEASFMHNHRKHAVIIILLVTAIITPTSDIFTLLLVGFPMWIPFECSILVVKLCPR